VQAREGVVGGQRGLVEHQCAVLAVSKLAEVRLDLLRLVLLAEQVLLRRLVPVGGHRSLVHPVEALDGRRLVAAGSLQLAQLLQLALLFDVLAQLLHLLLLGRVLLLGDPHLLDILKWRKPAT
jgi:hypothetical protein